MTRRLLSAVFLFALNGFIAARLFWIEYLPYMSSIEGAFVALARYIGAHRPMYEWFPMWFEGMPFASVYQPGLHYTVAALAAITHWSAAHAYHFTTAVTYSLGPVALFLLATELGLRAPAPLTAGLLYSLLSPSLLLVPFLARDAGGFAHARRLQALVVYGEGPNITGLTLLLFALAALHAAHRRRTPGSTVLAAAAFAAVAATSWPSTAAVTLAVVCYCLASLSLRRTLLITVLAYGVGCALILPSTVLRTFTNASGMGDAPVKDLRYYAAWSALATAVALLCWVLRRVSFSLRFAALWALVLVLIVCAVAFWNVQLLPQAMRFHLAMEAPVVLLLAALLQRSKAVLAIVGLSVCAFQIPAYRGYAREILRPADIQSSIEYRTAQFFDRNLAGRRVYAPGSISFWMNAFTDMPQLTGCCDQSVVNPGVRVPQYVIPAGDADQSLLWLQAYGVHAMAIGRPCSREVYKPYARPDQLAGKLRELWHDGADFVYEVPQRSPNLVRVVRAADLVEKAPVQVPELRRFVEALKAPGLPMQPDQVFEVAVNYHPGWSARVNGKSAPVRSDGLGFLVVEPHCSGPCNLELAWSAGIEPHIAAAVSLLTWFGAALWIAASRRTRRRDSGSPEARPV